MAKNEHLIYVKTEHRKKLKEKFECSDATLSEALNFKSQSLRSRRIRQMAINVYGGIMF